MDADPLFFSPAEFARRTGYQRPRINEFCLRRPGFGWRAHRHGWWRIPSQHVVRLLNGESLDSIAASPSIPRLDKVPSKTAQWLREGADAPAA